MTTLETADPTEPIDLRPSARRLEVEHLTAGYGSVTVLRDVSLTVPPGYVAAVLGPNGAGKTTLLRSIFGMTKVIGGAVRYDGVDLTGSEPHRVAREGLCYVTEGRAIYRGLTVADNLKMFGGRGNDDRLARVYDTFPILAERRRQTAGTMSGGQQQMLALARALLQDPKILLVDELSMGLAPVVVDDLFDILRELKAAGQSILLVEQYAERALELADVVYVLNRGQVAFAGDPEALSSAPELMALYLGG